MQAIINSECVSWANKYKGPRFHALLSDAPYELGFMGKDWDKSGVAFDPKTWQALGGVLLPGAFGAVFAAARGWHRLATAIEDAGLIIHPSIFGWAYGNGMPKATRIDSQIDRAAGAERQKEWTDLYHDGNTRQKSTPDKLIFNKGIGNGNYRERAATPLAKTWEGYRYGLQAIKPALEPIIIFQKPYEGKPWESIVETGAGALNIDAARIEATEPGDYKTPESKTVHKQYFNNNSFGKYEGPTRKPSHRLGRWPANLVLDEQAAERIGEQSGILTSGALVNSPRPKNLNVYAKAGNEGQPRNAPGSTGTAARFYFTYQADALGEADPVFYMAKASQSERDAGIDHNNPHPAIKPIGLTTWLGKLLLPPAEYAPRRIVVPFAGTGSEMIGCCLAGWDEVIGVEMDPFYAELAKDRLAYWTATPRQESEALPDDYNKPDDQSDGDRQLRFI